MMKFFLLLAAAAPLFAQTCTSYSLSGSGILASGAGTGTTTAPTFTVTTQTGCPFIVTTQATWLHPAAPATGTNFTGANTISFTVDANPGTLLRSAQILIYPGTVGNTSTSFLSFTVIQVATTCTYSASTASATAPVGGTTGSFTVTSGCAWSLSASSFISVTATSGTVGNGLVNYTVAANPCVAPRTGQIVVNTGATNPPTVTIAQDGSTSNLSIPATTVNLSASAFAGQRMTVTAGSGCSWSSYTDSSNWLHTTGSTSGSGSGAYVWSADANPGGQRTGHIYFESGTDGSGNPIVATTMTVVQAAYQLPAPAITAVLNGASFAVSSTPPEPVSPGEIVAIFGSNLGPTVGVANTSSSGTNLGAVTVMFGQWPAPLTYVSAQQINAVVPYEVKDSTSIAAVVQFNGQFSAPFTLPVQAATPGIFSYDHSGTGPGAILNQDYTLNSPARPAAAGSVAQIYCTGAGVTLPASTDGALAASTPPFPTLLTQPVTVTIGGVSAQVVYQGPAPGLLSGLTQIDAVVPGGLKSGTSVPVVLTIGGNASQGNLSIAVQ